MEEEPASSASSSEQAAPTQEAKAGDNSEDTQMEVVDKVGSSGKQQEQAVAAEHAEARDSAKEDDDDDDGAAAVETEATESESTALTDAQQTEPTQLESQQQQQEQQQQPQQAEPTAASAAAAAAEAAPAGDEAEAVTVTPVKRPKSAYFHFMMKHRLKFKQDNPGLKLGPLQKLIGAKWQSMSDDDKAVRAGRRSLHLCSDSHPPSRHAVCLYSPITRQLPKIENDTTSTSRLRCAQLNTAQHSAELSN